MSGTDVSCCSPLFTPITVKSLSNCPPTRDSQRHKNDWPHSLRASEMPRRTLLGFSVSRGETFLRAATRPL